MVRAHLVVVDCQKQVMYWEANTKMQERQRKNWISLNEIALCLEEAQECCVDRELRED